MLIVSKLLHRQIISHADRFQNKAILLIHFSARYELDVSHFLFFTVSSYFLFFFPLFSEKVPYIYVKSQCYGNSLQLGAQIV